MPQPRIRNTRDCTDEIKSSCVQVSVNCGISAKMSTIAIQIVCKSLYNHKFYLTKDETIAEDPDLISYNGHRYTLRPLFFAYEDRAQISCLLVETYRWLAIVVTVKSSDTTVVTPR